MATQEHEVDFRRRHIANSGSGDEEIAEASHIAPSFKGKITMSTIDQSKGKLTKKYDLFAHKFNELYLAGKDRGHEAMDVALEKSREQLTALGEFSAHQGEDLKRYLARDLDQAMTQVDESGEEAKEKCHRSRMSAGALASLASVLDSSSDAKQSLSRKTSEALVYRTGEMTTAGTLTCKACGAKVQFKATGHVPSCPKCSGPLFTKGF